MKSFSKSIKILPFLAILFLLCLSPAQGAMSDYCITPPFIVGGVNPNLLLMLDNSASMFDLAYLDKGSATRDPLYCSDRTYNYNQRYAGYFQDFWHYYEYNFSNGYFEEVSAPVWTSCNKYIPGTLCVNGTNLDNTSTPKTVTKFVAEGNYLNWLSVSKFDIQKGILTGGKYIDKMCASSTEVTTLSCATDADCPTGDTCIDVAENYMKAETRGCVGRRFLKLPLQEHDEVWDESGTHTPLGLTFAIKGPDHPYSTTLLSPGGQTYLEIYAGTYDIDGDCADAIDAIIDGEHKNVITGYLELCLNYSSQGQAKYCSLDFNTQCDDDTDCAGTPGTCNVVSDGVCGTVNNGVCSITTTGDCTPNNGTCSASKVCIGGSDAGTACNNNNKCDSKLCSKICQGGGKDGSTCTVNADCNYSSCTAGKIGSICITDANCDVQNCTSGLVGNACVANSDCNTKECTAGLVGNACSFNTDCNSGLGTCSAGNIGAPCALDIECGIGYKGFCQKPVTSQIKTTFTQSVHECTQYWDTGALVGNNWLPMITNPEGCNQMYKDLFTCRGGSRDTQLCETDADCPSGECINGPEAIRPGSPVLICSLGYAGYCASSTCSGGVNNGMNCMVPADCPGGKCWQSTIWNPREYATVDLCVQTKFEEYCAGAQEPPVTDPSDDPSTTENFDNLPAIIGDMAVGSQLGYPLIYAGCTSNCALAVKLKAATPPTGLIQEFEDLIHFGAMRFNYYGTSSECPANIPCEKICQNALTTCRLTSDCPQGDSCVAATNLDGARIINSGAKEGYILGRCSTATTTTCTTPVHCPAGEACLYSVGNHSTGFIKALDNIFASTWTPFSEGFYNAIGYFAQRTDIRINDSADLRYKDFATEAESSDFKDPVQYLCQKNNILLVTDGMSTADLHASVTALVTTYNDGDGQINTTASATCPEYAGSRNLDDLSWLGKHKNINDFTETPLSTDPAINSKTITTHVVFNGTASNDPGECNPDTLLDQTADNGGGTYQRAEDPASLRQALREAFLLIAGKAASGTAASVLASGEGTGANLVQAIFYPERTFGATEIAWTGSMKNLWYHIDPFLGNSTIREDTVQDKTLRLDNDYIVNFFFNPSTNLTEAKLFTDADGDGVKDSATPASTVYFENIKNLWESGQRLWETLPADRIIYTTTDESTRLSFASTSLAGNPALITLLQSPNEAAAAKLMNYVRGTDYGSKFCSRAVSTACTQNTDCPDVATGETCLEYRNRTVTIGATSRPWKLGDVINSTPRIASWVPMNFYYKTYQDKSYKAFTESSTYTDRGMVFVGANDGMLHAFNLGYLKLFEDKFKKAQLCNSANDCTTANIGREEWAFIPKNALPYLQYMADPGYCHLYFTDLTPYIFDASIGGLPNADKPENGSSWRTILIGGMRLGGACKDVASSLGVQVPIATEGYSSYFALDITDQDNPQVLWEFSNADIADPSGTGKLGFATTGPAILRVSEKKVDGITPNHTKNGHWFVVFGSGPTGPINTTTHQFMGYSDQNLKVFVLDLATGALLRTFDTAIPYAFSGSMYQAAIDFDQNDTTKNGFYSDDALYFGFTRAETNPPVATTKWNMGGVLRLLTKDDSDPANWTLSTVIGCNESISATDCVGPITAGIAKLQNYKDDTVRLFFGSGRFFYRVADVIDDADIGRRLYGVKEPCYSSSGVEATCDNSDKVAWTDLTEAADADGTSDSDGWYINLDSSAGTLKAERMVTDALATGIGAVFFTTTKPSADVCEFGGASHLWAVKYDTGGAVSSNVLRGRALLQVSTGSIEEVSLKEAFTEKDGRRTPAFQGVPPAGTPPGIMIPPKPMDRILHIREQ
ncbi:MAG: PilC/PilY family type IV pilus protein [Thermodesulfovibrionales bacterium]|nr:PilC/PilY family type IV pilus protein [Thermodesulfovibrionales bacterium]